MFDAALKHFDERSYQMHKEFKESQEKFEERGRQERDEFKESLAKFDERGRQERDEFKAKFDERNNQIRKESEERNQKMEERNQKIEERNQKIHADFVQSQERMLNTIRDETKVMEQRSYEIEIRFERAMRNHLVTIIGVLGTLIVVGNGFSVFAHSFFASRQATPTAIQAPVHTTPAVAPKNLQ